MTHVVQVRGRSLRLERRNIVGSGGEADVYRIGSKEVLKVWKPADHPDFAGESAARRAAARRLELLQGKMKALAALAPWPDKVAAPIEPALDPRSGRIIGFTMRRIDGAVEIALLAKRPYRASGVSGDRVRRALLDLHTTLEALHRRGVIVGDLNDLNVLVAGDDAWLIDVDSVQLPGYPCLVYTERFLDPLLTDGATGRPTLDRPYVADSDWYAFAVMTMQSLLFVGPYGGVYRPGRASGSKVAQPARPLHRLTVFHPDVRYPKPALPLESLPDDVLHWFVETFVRDRRGTPPRRLLEDLRFSTCDACGLEHARGRCPRCATTVAVSEAPLERRGRAVVRDILRTGGRIITVRVAGDRLRWLVHEDGAYRREDGRVVARGPLRPDLAFEIVGEETLVAGGGLLRRLGAKPGTAEVLAVDDGPDGPAVTATARGAVWIDGGQIFRDGPYGPEPVGDALRGLTRLWSGGATSDGERPLTFGLARAGSLLLAFLLGGDRAALNDEVTLPRSLGRGKLRGAECAISTDRCWLFTEHDWAGRLHRTLTVLDSKGRVLATRESDDDTPGWLEPGRGRCAAAESLLVASDDGLVRLEVRAGDVVESATFPDTAPFIDAGSRLLPHAGGLVIVHDRSVRLLRIDDEPERRPSHD